MSTHTNANTAFYGWETPYLGAVDHLLKNGDPRAVRNGETVADFAHRMRFDLTQGFPLLTTKKLNFELILAELIWFIEGGRKPNADRGEIYGRMSIHRLSEIYGKNCTIWDGDYANFLAAGKTKFDGDCSRIYGAQWRDYSTYFNHATNDQGRMIYVRESKDQLAELIEKIKTDPNGRYARVTAWNPGELHDMALPACHTDFQCYVGPNSNGERALHMHMNQRSCDIFLGVPFNIASYALLTHMLAQVCDLAVGSLHITLNDYHIYTHEGKSHVEQCKLQLTRTPYAMPRIELNPEIKNIDNFTMDDIKLIGYESHPHIPGKMSASKT